MVGAGGGDRVVLAGLARSSFATLPGVGLVSRSSPPQNNVNRSRSLLLRRSIQARTEDNDSETAVHAEANSAVAEFEPSLQPR